MNDWEILKRLDMVKAPPDFEQTVMARLSLRKREERRKRMILRWSMAGSFASLAAVFILLNIFVFEGRSPSGLAEKERDAASASSILPAAEERTIPIIETLDYRTEIRSRSSDPEAIFLLEQISDTTSGEIRY